MPRIPTTIQNQPFGTSNPKAPAAGGRVVRPPSVTLKGPAQGLAQFNDPALSAETNRQLNQLQQLIAAALEQIKANPLSNGNLTRGVYFPPSTTVVVHHGLGRKFEGFFVVNQRLDPVHGGSSPVDIIQVANSDPRLDEFQISLASDGSFLGDVWVY